MSHEAIISTALRIDPFGADGTLYKLASNSPETLAAFVAAFVADEREACARTCEGISHMASSNAPVLCAMKIRARSRHAALTAPAAEVPEAMGDAEILAANYPDGDENGPTVSAPDFDLICFAKQVIAARDAQWQSTRLRGGVPEPVWIVNDLGELGVKVGERFFFLYKGDNIEYEDVKHGDGTQMRYRIVGKREFGEVCWPLSWLKAGRSEARYTVNLTYIPGLSWGKPEDGEWRDLPPAPLTAAPPASHVPEADFGNNQPASQEQAQQPSGGEVVAWMYDFAIDGEVLRNWTTSDYSEIESHKPQVLNVRPLTLATTKPEPMTWQPIETAPENTGGLAVVRWVDDDGQEHIELDCAEDGCWIGWHDRAEHVEIIGGHGVSYTPPYTQWLLLSPTGHHGITKGEA